MIKLLYFIYKFNLFSVIISKITANLTFISLKSLVFIDSLIYLKIDS